MQSFADKRQCHYVTMKTVPYTIRVLLIFIFITVINNYGECRPQSGQPSQPQAGSPLDPNDISNGGNNSAISRRGWRGEWRRTDPGTVYSYIWKSSDQPLGKAELYIILALLIGMATVIVGCWLSDNCWSPEPEQHYTIAWHDRHRWI